MIPTALDRFDIRILAALQAKGRLGKAKLAEQVGLSPTPCWVRLQRLEKAGLVRGYRAEIALERLADVTQVVVTISLSQHRRSDFDRFECHVRAAPEIVSCIATGGGMDYVMTVVCANLTKFQALMDNMLEAGVGIERYFTYIATRQVKSAAPDLERLLSER